MAQGGRKSKAEAAGRSLARSPGPDAERLARQLRAFEPSAPAEANAGKRVPVGASTHTNRGPR